jgi:uncharacterized protein
MMRFGTRSAIGVATWAAAILAVCCSAWGQQTFDNRPKISVSGEALVYVQPDKILVRLGVETWDAHMAEAKQKNDAIVKKAIAAVLECGVERKAIQTDNLFVEPTYKPYSGSWPRDVDGYVVRNSLTVTVDRVATVERVITGALEVGVNHVHGVDFQTTELRKHRDKARRLALKAAREKAQDMAEALGQTIGKPLQITENQGYWGYCGYWGWGGSGRDYGMSQNVMSNTPAASSGEGGETVALGKIGVRANVTVVFELKDK